MNTSSKQPIISNSWSKLNKATICDETYALNDINKEILTFGFIRIATNNKIEFPLDIVGLLINYICINCQKPNISLCVIGFTASGKSTLCGRLLYDLGIETNDHLPEESIKHLMTKHQKEKEMGQSYDFCIKHFYSHYYHYTLIDTPGYIKYIKNMIYGASQADIAILVIPANKDSFEPSMVKQHVRICHTLGIKQLIVCINKMDDCTVKYSQERFHEIKTKTIKILSKIGYKTKKIPFIPISAMNGYNVIKPATNQTMCWYQGFNVKIHKRVIHGYTLLDAMDNVVNVPKRDMNENDETFIFTVSRYYKLADIGHVLCGRVDKGRIKRNDMVRIYPANILAQVKSLQIHQKSVQEAFAGDLVGIALHNTQQNSLHNLHCGDVMYSLNGVNAAKPVKSFTAQVFVQKHCGKLKPAKWKQCSKRKAVEIPDHPLPQKDDVKRQSFEWVVDVGYKGGYTPIIYIKGNKSPAQMTRILWKKGKSTNNEKVKTPKYIEYGDEAEIEFMPIQPMIITSFDECQIFGRLIVMDHGKVVMIGKVIDIGGYMDISQLYKNDKPKPLKKCNNNNVSIWDDGYNKNRIRLIATYDIQKPIIISKHEWIENKNKIQEFGGLMNKMYGKFPYLKKNKNKTDFVLIESKQHKQIKNDSNWKECVIKALIGNGVIDVKIVTANHATSTQS